MYEFDYYKKWAIAFKSDRYQVLVLRYGVYILSFFITRFYLELTRTKEIKRSVL